MEQKKTFVEKAKEKVGNALRMAVKLKGTISSIGGSSIVVSTDGGTYTVNITGDTKLLKRFGGEATLSEFVVGHTVQVVGKWTDENKTTVDARLIRNVSIQKRFGVFTGSVISVGGDNFVLETKRGNQTVYVGSAKIVNRKGETITLADIMAGHKVRAKGMWDNTNNMVTETTHVKDFSIPTPQAKNTQ